MLSRLKTCLADHWNGRVALLPTCLITLLGLRLLLDWFGTARPVNWPFALVLALSLLSGLVLVWQLVGGARAVARVHDLLVTTAGALVLLVTAVLFLWAELSHWSARRMVAPAIAAQPAPMVVTDGTVRITGTISFATLNRFDATLKAHPAVRRIELMSDGGHVPTARALAVRIETAGLETRAVGLCASACTLVFMAGHARSLAPGAELGFHAYRLESVNPFHSVPDEEARDRSYLSARGVSDSFIARAFATPPDQLWRPTPEELRAAGLLTD